MSRRSYAVAAALSVCCLPWPAAALNPGELDPAFSTDGFTTVDIKINSEARNNSATHVLIQTDGTVVLAGAAQSLAGCADCTQRMVAVRLTATGATDGSFGNGGIVRVDGLTGQTDEEYYDGRLGFAPNGNIYLYDGTQDSGGTIGWASARLALSNGALDTGWDGDGRRSLSTSGIAGDISVQADGSVLVLDDIFDTAATPDNEQMRVCRYTDTGAADATFGDAGCRIVSFDLGTTKNDFARVMMVHPDGRIVVAGGAEGSATAMDFAIALLTADGDLDGTFGGDGKVTLSFGLGIGNLEEVRALGVDARGRIYAGGIAGNGSSANDCALARFLPNGDPDPDFGGGDGKVNFDFTNGSATFEQIFGLAIQGDGRIVVAGRGSNGSSGRRAGVARLTEAGDLDLTFAGDGAVNFDFGNVGNTVGRSLALDQDGSIVISGYAKSSDNDFFAARIYNDYIFADAFESNDFSYWSEAIP